MLCKRRCGIVRWVVFAQYFCLSALQGATVPQFMLTHQAPESLRISFRSSWISTSVVSINGVSYTVLGAGGESSGHIPGAPYLPSHSFSVGIPPNAEPVVDLENATYGSPETIDIAPVPEYEFSAEGEAIPVYRLDEEKYSQNTVFPARQLDAGPPALIRQQRVFPVRLTPYQYNPATRQLRRVIRADIVIHFNYGNATAGLRVPAADPRYEGVFKNLLLNYEQARLWRSIPLSKVAAVKDSTRDWFHTGKTYVRLPVANDGWYHITPAELQNLGPPLMGFDTSSATVIVRGKEIPLLIWNDGGVGFMGRRNHGDSTYDDFYTDTLAHWLAWGGPDSGKRYLPAPVTGVTPADTISFSLTTRHYEQNTDYYEGTGEREVTQNGMVAGEGWAWEYYYPNSTYQHTFVLDSLAVGVPASPRLRIYLFSTTLRYNTPDHIARIWINDSLLADIAFNGRTRGYLDTAVSPSWLRNGPNTIRITSIPTPSSPNQFYLDWFEIDYPRVLCASSDQVEFGVAGPPQGKVTRIMLKGFSLPSIDVIDLSRGRRLLSLAIGGDGGSGYTCSFVDTVRGLVRYTAVASPGALHATGMAARQFSDIRNNVAGADYLIITHGNFATAAQELAAHRGTRTGERVAVVNVQDIYDEFGFGQTGAAPIKQFLRYAYENWAAPALSSVLFFGDASWDPHRYMTTSTATNFVPAYGVPSGDNWFVCFDPAFPFLPAMTVGRLPVLEPAQASRLVQKLKGYDALTPAAWQKRFLFINGGDTQSEKNTFLAASEAIIADHVLPAPVGGLPLRVYKETPATIDGENRDVIRGHIAEGLLFMNFLGHSGGRIWNVDMGNPNDLQNTNGRLPFVSSVSCNVGAFAEPAYATLGEELVLADNRGAIAAWASSSLGYASVGATLVNSFLRSVADDSVRNLGTATTLARYQLWQQRGSDYITLASMNLNPLLGDPGTELALARKPDLEIAITDILPSIPAPTIADTGLTVTFNLRNFGLVVPDSTEVRITDTFDGQVRDLVPTPVIGPTFAVDSLRVPWGKYLEPGMHTIACAIDPAGVHDEVSRANNTASIQLIVYANILVPVRPLENAIVPPGLVDLVLSSPIGKDSILLVYDFELDTAHSFDSPARVFATGVQPGPVGGRWKTPSLNAGQVYFWRGRTVLGSSTGKWVEGTFFTESGTGPPPDVKLRATDRKAFERAQFRSTQLTDSSISLVAAQPLKLKARSLGYRANPDKDYYSILGVGTQTIFGLWWVSGSSFMALRLDDFTGTFAFKAFDVAARASESDSLARFLDTTPVGDYIALTVIFDGKSNVNTALKNAIRSFGSAYIDSLQPGHAWMLIGRKGASGPGMPPLEKWSAGGVAEDSIEVPNYFSVGSGSVEMSALPMPSAFRSLSWSNRTDPGITNAVLHIVGIRGNGGRDTLRSIPSDSLSVNLSALAPVIADTAYVRFTIVGGLHTLDATKSPSILGWNVDLTLPPDLAVSSRTIGVPADVLQKSAEMTLPVTVYNIGYRAADSARVVVSLRQPDGSRRVVGTAMLGSIPVDSARSTLVSFSSSGFGATTTLEVTVAPPAGTRDLLVENNSAPFSLNFTSVSEPLAATVRVFADGVPLMDGDYVSSEPRFLVQLSDLEGIRQGQERVNLYVDNVPVALPGAAVTGGTLSTVTTADGMEFTPRLADGSHEIVVRLYRWNGPSGTDSIQHRVAVNVVGDYRILRVYNYPNPFATTTEFTFVLTGRRSPDEVSISIFTISGRRIRDIIVPQGMLQVGFNRVFWDGRDADGDEVANGYYFYKVQVKGEGKIESAIEKMAKIR